MTRISSIHTLSTMDVGRPLTVAAPVDMGLTADTSLLALDDAALQGKGIAWEDGAVEIRPLTSLPRASLEVLKELRKEFARIRQKKGYADAKAGGASVGRPLRELPPGFERQAQRYLAGETSGREAARVCGMPYSSFVRRVKDSQLVQGKEKAVLPPHVADACHRWGSRELTRKAAAAEAGVSISMFTRILAAHGFTRTSRKQRFADVCAKWEAGAISKQTAVRESGVSITEFNALLRKVGKPLHFAGEKPRWLEVLESGTFDAVYPRFASGELSREAAAVTCGLSLREFDNALQELGWIVRTGVEYRAARAVAEELYQNRREALPRCSSTIPKAGRCVFYSYGNTVKPEHHDLPPGVTVDAAFRDAASAARPQLAVCLASLQRGDTLCVAQETHLADDLGQAIDLLCQLAHRGVNVWFGSTGRFVCSEDSPFLRLDAKVAAAIVRFRQMFAAHEAHKGTRPRIARSSRVGRPCLPLPEGFEDARTAWLEGRMNCREAAASCGMAVSTFAKKARA